VSLPTPNMLLVPEPPISMLSRNHRRDNWFWCRHLRVLLAADGDQRGIGGRATAVDRVVASAKIVNWVVPAGAVVKVRLAFTAKALIMLVALPGRAPGVVIRHADGGGVGNGRRHRGEGDAGAIGPMR